LSKVSFNFYFKGIPALEVHPIAIIMAHPPGTSTRMLACTAASPLFEGTPRALSSSAGFEQGSTTGFIPTRRTFAEHMQRAEEKKDPPQSSSQADTVAQYCEEPRALVQRRNTDRTQPRLPSNSIRRRGSHSDLRTVAYYSDRSLPPLPAQPPVRQRSGSWSIRSVDSEEKPLLAHPDDSLYAPTFPMMGDGPAKWRDGPERRGFNVLLSQDRKGLSKAATVECVTSGSI
jgi:hypothetical protein